MKAEEQGPWLMSWFIGAWVRGLEENGRRGLEQSKRRLRESEPKSAAGSDDSVMKVREGQVSHKAPCLIQALIQYTRF